MMNIFTFLKNKSLRNSFLLLFGILLFTSCSKNPIAKSLGYECRSNFLTLRKTKTVTDPLRTFDVEIHKEWDKEKVEFRGTSSLRIFNPRGISKTYELYIEFTPKKLTFDKAFFEEIEEQKKNERISEIINTKLVDFKNKKCYCILTESNHFRYASHKLEIYALNNDDSYYYIKLLFPGTENMNDRICWGIQALEDLTFKK